MSKRKRYEVSIVRTVEHHATVEVEARSDAEARALALKEVDKPRSGYWTEGDINDESISVREMK